MHEKISTKIIVNLVWVHKTMMRMLQNNKVGKFGSLTAQTSYFNRNEKEIINYEMYYT